MTQYDETTHIVPGAQSAGAVILKKFSGKNKASTSEWRVLLVQQGQGALRGLWHIPSGKIETGELPENAAVREVYEETGQHITLSRYLGAYLGRLPDGSIIIRHAWLAQQISSKVGEDIPSQQADAMSGDDEDKEIVRSSYFSLEEVRELYETRQLRMYFTKLCIEDAFKVMHKEQ